MSWIAQRPSSFIGQMVGDGQCVAYVQRASDAPQTALWRRGALVKGSNTPQGTAIATFDPTGVYGNHVDGRSHAAIFHEQFPRGCSSGTNGSIILLTPGSSGFRTATAPRQMMVTNFM
jgi:hypothetical protein